MKKRILTAEEIRENYTKKEIVHNYFERKFVTPIGTIEHTQQVDFVNKIIRKYSPKKVLEIACGPARLTRAITLGGAQGLAVDFSEGMLKEAKKILKGRKEWNFKKVDVFKMDFSNEFDLVFTFRFLFHFNKKKRQEIYKKIRDSLKDDGILIFEAINARKSIPLKKIVRLIYGKDTYLYYRKHYFKKELLKELKDNGFEVVEMESNIRHFYAEVAVSKITNLIGANRLGESIIKFFERFGGSNPIWWTVAFRKIK